jgi:hypothetical protein
MNEYASKKLRVYFWLDKLLESVADEDPKKHREKMLPILVSAMEEASELGYAKAEKKAGIGEHARSSLAESVGRKDD